MERKAFENNEVLLWGEKPVKKSLLEEFDKGNKNPISIARKKPAKVKTEEPKKPIKRVFSLDEDYGVQDLDFLNKEYERIDKEIEASGWDDDELMDIQEKLYDLIEGLEQMKKMTGGKGVKVFDDLDDDYIGTSVEKRLNKLIGKGFKKGSPEAIAHAEKMRKILEEKKGNKQKVVRKAISTKARVEKGSEEAKALGRRLAEAKKKKAEEAKKAKEEQEAKKPKEIIKPKGKPWFYIGDIPKGYREATEDEAIMAKKVSLYGKYVVDSEKWRLFKDYNILLTTDKTNQEIRWSMSGLKRRIIESLKEIEILSSKLDNEKYKDKWQTFNVDLEEEKEKRKYLQAGYNWYYKLLCERTGVKYERQKIELEKKVIEPSKPIEKIEWKPPKRPIDPRTGKEAEYIFPTEDKKEEKPKGVIDVELWFEKDGDLIGLSTKYFTQDYKLKSKYVKKLLDKNIVLKKKHYTTEDYNKYFYGKVGEGINGYGLVNRHIPSNKDYIIQSIIFDKNKWNKIQAKKWLKDNGHFYDNIDEKENTYRFRQYSPEDLQGKKYKTINKGDGIEEIIAY